MELFLLHDRESISKPPCTSEGCKITLCIDKVQSSVTQLVTAEDDPENFVKLGDNLDGMNFWSHLVQLGLHPHSKEEPLKEIILGPCSVKFWLSHGWRSTVQILTTKLKVASCAVN